MEPSAPGWYPDPSGRHERRYWSGIRWSRHVEDGGFRAEDPLDGGPVATVPVQRHHTDDRPSRPERPWPPALPGTVEPPRSRLRARATGNRDPFAGPRAAAPGPRDPGPPDDPRHARSLDDPPPRGRRTALLAMAAGVVAGLAGAAFLLLRGGDGDPSPPDGEDDPVTLAMVGVMDEKSGGTVSEGEASCMAQAFIDIVGADRLVELGVLEGRTDGLGPEEMATALPVAFSCLDDTGMLTFMEATWTPDSVTGLDPALAPCVFEGWLAALGRDQLIEVYTTFAQVDPPPMTEVLAPAEFDAAMRVLSDCQAPPA